MAAWILLGAVFYTLSNEGFDFADGLYFSIQVGFSIGFGSLTETTAESRYYSCFHMLTGTTICVVVVCCNNLQAVLIVLE